MKHFQAGFLNHLNHQLFNQEAAADLAHPLAHQLPVDEFLRTSMSWDSSMV